MKNLVQAFYKGANAQSYNSTRINSQKWTFEDRVVSGAVRDLANKIRSIADVPVGTGRFLPIFDKYDRLGVTGYDLSREMLLEAHKVRSSNQSLLHGDILKGPLPNKADLVICCRFLNLIDVQLAEVALENLLSSCGLYLLISIRVSDDLNDIGKVEDKIYIHSEPEILSIFEGLGLSIEKEYIYFDDRPGKYSFFLCSIVS